MSCVCVCSFAHSHLLTHTISSMYSAHIASDFRNKCAQMHTHSTAQHMFYLVFCHGIPPHSNKEMYHFECEYCAATTLKSEVKTILKKIYESFTWYDKARSRASTYTNTNTNFLRTAARSRTNAAMIRIQKRNVTNSNTSFVWFTLHNITLEGNGAILCYRNSIFIQVVCSEPNRTELIHGSKVCEHIALNIFRCKLLGICSQISNCFNWNVVLVSVGINFTHSQVMEIEVALWNWIFLVLLKSVLKKRISWWLKANLINKRIFKSINQH